MNICAYQFEDESYCMQVPGHEKDGVPHMKYGEGARYWSEHWNKKRDENKTIS